MLKQKEKQEENRERGVWVMRDELLWNFSGDGGEELLACEISLFRSFLLAVRC